ncbi:hypothetical protein [Terriglobus sp. TAA 43]|uniref:hypothetical protein n=1 Tax=Terriglobus sp. TAA 43 TaxID=278961 RepID=UPI0018DE2198|nr:hypothetical protein [Terriglobus sp. TAA 43]
MTKTVRLLLLASFVTLPAAAQSSSPNPSPTSGGRVPSGDSSSDIHMPLGTASDSDTGIDPALIRRREEARKLDRKKRMVDNANRLLALTQQLRADLQGREATPEDQKRLDEIARLARQVKDQMRN